MFFEEYDAAASTAKRKAGLLRGNFFGYLFLSMLAGSFVGFGILLGYTVGGALLGLPAAKIAMGMSFGIAFSLVLMAGGELFTGNVLTMSAGLLRKTVSLPQVFFVLFVCFAGNWLGSIALALVYNATGLSSGALGEYIAAVSAAKMALPAMQLFWRGVLCNALVCLGTWCSYRMKSESGKLIMSFWCLFAFVTCGFEHCIANMTLLTLALLNPAGAAVSLAGYFYNIGISTLGNIVGALLFVSLPYFVAARKKAVK